MRKVWSRKKATPLELEGGKRGEIVVILDDSREKKDLVNPKYYSK
jgi:hypothetical protein